MAFSKIIPAALALAMGLMAAGARTSAEAQQTLEPLQMVPSTGWVADYAEDSCMLRRAFRADDDSAILELRQFFPGDTFEVVLVSDTLIPTRQPPRVRFDPDTDWYEPSHAFFVDSGDRHGVLYIDSLRPVGLKPKGAAWPAWPHEERPAREQQVTGLAVAGSFERDLSLQIGTMGAPMQALRTCMDDLVTQWGLDPAAQGTLSRPVQPRNPNTWMARATTYPPEMVRTEQEARIAVRLIIGADGKPMRCLLTRGLANPAFGEAACGGLMRYGRFEPALDADGAPVASLYVTTMDYSLN